MIDYTAIIGESRDKTDRPTSSFYGFNSNAIMQSNIQVFLIEFCLVACVHSIQPPSRNSFSCFLAVFSLTPEWEVTSTDLLTRATFKLV